MRTIFFLSDMGHATLLIFLFMTLNFQILVCCMGYFYRIKWIHGKALFVLSTISILLLSFFSSGVAIKNFGEPMWEITRKLMGIPAVAIYIYIVLTVGYACWVLWYEQRYRKSTITSASVRESTNLMTIGFCFFKGEGQLILVNLKMEKLSNLLCGEELLNGEEFWQTVSQGNLKSGARRSRILNVPAVILPDESAWIFDRQIINMDGEAVVQITATDATELYGLTKKLKQKNAVLREMNTRLKAYRHKVDELTRAQQRLSVKIRIHDSIGQNLMMTRYYLVQEAQGDSKQDSASIIQKWQQTIAWLRLEVEPDESKGAFQYLIDAAKSAGVEVVLQGEIPRENRVAELITAAGAEALTNAVRHAAAKQLKVNIFQTELVVNVVFTNDGRVPEKPLREGGGLMSLRKRIEDEGGTMTIVVNTEFCLSVTIPKEGKVNVI